MTEIPPLIRQARKLLDEVEGGSTAAPIILARLPIFISFMNSTEAPWENLESIPATIFPEFVEYLESQLTEDNEIHLTLASVRMILNLAGAKPTDLQKLVAPRIRKRRSNQGGKYHFELEKRSPGKEPDFLNHVHINSTTKNKLDSLFHAGSDEKKEQPNESQSDTGPQQR